MSAPGGVVDRGARLPVVLLHAFPLSSEMWREVRAALEPVDRIVTPDFSGFGGVPPRSDDPDLDRFAEEVFERLDEDGLDRVVLGGLSMGGYVAMACLRQQPERVAALLLADTKGSADTPEGREKRLTMADRLRDEGTPAALLQGVLPGLVGPTTKATRHEVLGRVTEAVREASPEGAAWAQRAMAARPDSLADLGSFGGPALVVRGEEDEQSTEADAEALVAALPAARLVTVPRAGHLAAVENPEVFVDVVRYFLDEVAATV